MLASSPAAHSGAELHSGTYNPRAANEEWAVDIIVKPYVPPSISQVTPEALLLLRLGAGLGSTPPRGDGRAGPTGPVPRGARYIVYWLASDTMVIKYLLQLGFLEIVWGKMRSTMQVLAILWVVGAARSRSDYA